MNFPCHDWSLSYHLKQVEDPVRNVASGNSQIYGSSISIYNLHFQHVLTKMRKLPGPMHMF